MANFDMRVWALKGAEQRLLEIADEAKAIYATFPELRDRERGSGAGVSGESSGRPNGATKKRRSRPAMSEEQRKAVSERMRKYWAGRKKEKK